MIHAAAPRQGHHLRLWPDNDSVSAARRFARRVLAENNRLGAVDDVTLVVSELVTNAVAATKELHARQANGITGSLARCPGGGAAQCVTRDAASENVTWVVLSLYVGPGKVVVEVWDRSDTRPTRRVVGGDSESGRGLLIVAAVGSAWGTRWPDTGGKVVWCQIGC